MKLQIITPDTELFSGEVDTVVVPGSDGEIGILNGHAPLVSSLNEGKVKIQIDNEEKFFEVKGGVVEVLNNNVIILAT
jgi:F-type H+-transporting ATPase subunit epsilon